jgi:hypothetical protein
MITKSTVVAAVIATVAIASPALAQSREHTGSMLPNYYDAATGKQQWGAWGPSEITASNAKPLYASVDLTTVGRRSGSHRRR